LKLIKSVLLNKPDFVPGWKPGWQSFILSGYYYPDSCDLPWKYSKRAELNASFTWSCSGWGLSIPEIAFRMVGSYPAVSPLSRFSVGKDYFSETLSTDYLLYNLSGTFSRHPCSNGVRTFLTSLKKRTARLSITGRINTFLKNDISIS